MRKIKVGDAVFSEAAYPIETEPSVFIKMRNIRGEFRESVRITVLATHNDASEAFIDGAEWGIFEGENYYDKSEFSVAGDIIDHRDGRITVYMAKLTEAEALRRRISSAIEVIGGDAAEVLRSILIF